MPKSANAEDQCIIRLEGDTLYLAAFEWTPNREEACRFSDSHQATAISEQVAPQCVVERLDGEADEE